MRHARSATSAIAASTSIKWFLMMSCSRIRCNQLLTYDLLFHGLYLNSRHLDRWWRGYDRLLGRLLCRDFRHYLGLHLATGDLLDPLAWQPLLLRCIRLGRPYVAIVGLDHDHLALVVAVN